MMEITAGATPPGGSWLQRGSHRDWLEAEGQRLLAFYQKQPPYGEFHWRFTSAFHAPAV